MLTMEERMDSIKGLNEMNKRIELGEKLIAECEKDLEEMKSRQKVMIELRDLYASILKAMEGDQ